jgi:predicted metalloprotease
LSDRATARYRLVLASPASDAAEGAQVKRTPTSLMALGLVSALAVACAQPADETLLTGGSTGDPAAVTDRAVDDVTAYWEQTYPEVYGDEFPPVAGFYPYGPDTQPPPCGTPPPRYDDIADNAFYCPGDDIIAWDEASLMPKLNRDFGAFTVAIVIAHEYGHAIQDRFGADDRTVDLELQADCFAGAWTQRVASGDAQGFEPGDIDLDKTVAGMIAIRDVPGTRPDDPFAHGSGFDRVSAFQDGYENGAGKCAEYADPLEERRTAEIPFGEGDFATEGNLPLEDGWNGPDSQGLYTLVESDLNDWYDWYFGQLGATWTPVDDLVVVDPDSDEVTCGGESLSGSELDRAALYCEDENIVVIDGGELVDDLYRIGDFAVASELAQLWAVAAQVQLGSADGDEADLQADCLTGYWAASTFPGVEDVTPTQLQISAGDLDEGIMGFVAFGSAGGEGPSVFDRTSALRTGVFGEATACEEYGPLD